MVRIEVQLRPEEAAQVLRACDVFAGSATERCSRWPRRRFAATSPTARRRRRLRGDFTAPPLRCRVIPVRDDTEGNPLDVGGLRDVLECLMA
jgi:hypothetical protein